MYSRTLTADVFGPLAFSVKGDAMSAKVVVGDNRRAEVVLTTDDEPGGPGRDAIAGLRLRAVPGKGVHLDLPDLLDGGTTIIQSDGNIHVSQRSTRVTGSISDAVISGGGDIVINGVRITPELLKAAGANVSSGVALEVRLPKGSSLDFSSKFTNLLVQGEALEEVSFSSQSGDLEATGSVSRINARSQSGDIDLSSLIDGDAMLSSQSGDIEVYAYGPGAVQASSQSGDVRVVDAARVGSALRVRARSQSGRVRQP